MNALYEIVSRILGIPAGSVTSELGPKNCTEWDSFNHLMIISEIEKELDVTVPMADMENIKTVGDLEKIISKK